MSYAVDIFIVEGDGFGLRWSNWNVWKSKSHKSKQMRLESGFERGRA